MSAVSLATDTIRAAFVSLLEGTGVDVRDSPASPDADADSYDVRSGDWEVVEDREVMGEGQCTRGVYRAPVIVTCRRKGSEAQLSALVAGALTAIAAEMPGVGGLAIYVGLPAIEWERSEDLEQATRVATITYPVDFELDVADPAAIV